MTYTAEISRLNPTAFLFLVDQSGSMNDNMTNEKSKSQFVADALNRTLTTLITRCTKADGTRDYFDIGVIGYGENSVYNGFQGPLGVSFINKISSIEATPLRVEDRKKKIDNGAGGLVEEIIKFPVWFEPRANGGTPMCQAIMKAAEELVIWCDSHPDSYPPTVLHITDGESTDGDPEELALKAQQIKTNDGPVVMFNCHVSASGNLAIRFPTSEALLPDTYSKLLFRMSSLLPDHLIQYAKDKGFEVGFESRGFMFNADVPEIVDFFDIGTRSAQLR